ncbi:hypothetical protein KBB27_02955 [Patescibacteria group bacterium]|nr:hypothetical protein [Patescibacteria group bacterium]
MASVKNIDGYKWGVVETTKKGFSLEIVSAAKLWTFVVPEESINDEILIIGYAGIRFFQGMEETLTEVRKRYPSAIIILITCRCHRRDLKGEDRPWNQYFYIRECLGDGGVGSFVDRLIEAYPSEAA